MQELSEQKKEVFAEARGEGFDVKRRREDKNERDERESLLDLYMRAMEATSPEQAKAAWGGRADLGGAVAAIGGLRLSGNAVRGD